MIVRMIVRQGVAQDAPAMVAILNQIIAIGGTTAHQVPMSEADLRRYYIDGAEAITCVVAEEAGEIIGWQAIGWWRGESHIGSFVKPGIQARGIGAALFAKSVDAARAAGLSVIHASIRADNVPGLAFYAKMGFVDYAVDAGFALSDGRVVGRIERRFDLI